MTCECQVQHFSFSVLYWHILFFIPYYRKAANFALDSYVSFVNEQILHLGVLSNYVMPLAKEKNKIRHLNHFDLLLKKMKNLEIIIFQKGESFYST